LNRVIEKPYSELPDSDDRPDAVLAGIWWRNHLSRENSIIQTLFSGQFKSVMTCKDCSFSSARYEPFTCLPVPIADGSSDIPTPAGGVDAEYHLVIHIMPRYVAPRWSSSSPPTAPSCPVIKCHVKALSENTLRTVLKSVTTLLTQSYPQR
jgi:Ubiquitin carboxyl-terminal hydrolase